MSTYYNDNDPSAAAWLRELMADGLIPEGEVDERSILDVEPADIAGFRQCHFFAGIGGWAYALRLAGWPDDRSVWTGSPPCQPFSVAGLNLGRDDPRHLAPHFLDLVTACRPPVIFGEQVASAAVFGKVAGGAGRRAAAEPEWAWLDDVSAHLEAAHYAFGASDLPAASVGAPHQRQRCFFGAYDLRLAAGGLADSRRASDEPRRHDVAGATREDQGAEEKRQRLRDDAGDGRDSRGAQHAACDGWQQRRAAPIGRSVAGGCGAVDLADGDDTRLQGRQLHTERADECAPRSGGLVDRQSEPGPVSGFWRDADWLFCTDGKWRPTEPGIQPLAHGVPGRVGLLRGAGNAIVPELAAEFIQAFERAREMTRAHA